MKTSYFASGPGRLMSGTLAFALLAAGALAAIGPGPHTIVFLSAVPLICIVAAFFAVGLSIRDHGGHAAALIIALPIATGPYLGLLIAAPHAGLVFAPVLLVPGAILAATSILGPRLLAHPADQTGSLQTH